MTDTSLSQLEEQSTGAVHAAVEAGQEDSAMEIAPKAAAGTG